MTTPQTLDRLKTAQANRLAKVEAIRRIRTGTLTIHDVLADPPDVLAGVLLPDLLMAVPFFGIGKLRHVGKRATWANINLLVSVGDAPPRTREWLSDDLASRQTGRGVRP